MADTERCEESGLIKEMCAHCRGWDWDDQQQQYVKIEKPIEFKGLLNGKPARSKPRRRN